MDSTAKYNVLQVARQLGMGGIGKTLQVFSQHLNKELFNVVVCSWAKEGGIRAEHLKDLGVKVYCTHNDQQKLTQLMQDEKIQIVHVHRPGLGDPFVIQAARAAGVPVIVETNVFGRVDETPWEQYIDCHLLKSKTCAVRYRHWKRLPWRTFFRRHRVLYNPIDLLEIDHYRPSPERIAQLKKQCGISANAPIIGRIGRPDPSKWPPTGSFRSMLKELIKLVPNVKILLMGAPPSILENLSKSREVKDRIVALDPSHETKEIMEFYSMLDVFAHSARIGESFGYVIAEAMALGKPVVSRSTPLHDNAQVELIDHGENGYITYSDRAMAEAIAEILSSNKKCEHMGLMAREKVEACYNVETLVRGLEGIYLELLQVKDVPVEPAVLETYNEATLYPLPEEIAAFEKEYRRRIRTCWGTRNWLGILGYEYLLRHHSIHRIARWVKETLHGRLPGRKADV